VRWGEVRWGEGEGKKNEGIIGSFKRWKKKLRNFHESFNINYSGSDVNPIASYKVERTQLCVKEVKRRKRFQRQILTPYIVIRRRLFYLNTNFTRFFCSFNYSRNPRLVAAVRYKMKLQQFSRGLPSWMN